MRWRASLAPFRALDRGDLSRRRLLCHRPRASGDFLPAAAAADLSRAPARALPHRQSVWVVRGDDSRALRNRIPGFARRQNLDAYPFRLQTAGPAQATWHLRTLSAAIRLESVVRLARPLAGLPLRVWTEERLLQNQPEVLELFAAQSVRRQRRPSKSARSFINIGSRTGKPSAKPVHGGAASHSANMPRRSSASRTEKSCCSMFRLAEPPPP